MVGISYALFAIPSGKIAHKFGRRKTIRVSLAILVVILFAIFAHDRLTSVYSKFKTSILFGLYYFALVLFGLLL